MTPVATKTSPKTETDLDPLEIVGAAENASAAASEAATEAGTELQEQETRYRALLDERQSLIHREPELIDHRGKPVDSKGPVAKIDAELGKIDLDDLRAKYAHTREVERAKRQSFEQQIRNHGDAIDEARKADADVIRDRHRAAAETLVAVNLDWLNHAHRSIELANIRGLDNRGIPIEAASNALKAARKLADSEIDVR